MPQLGKGGKFVFGWSKINQDNSVQFPIMAVDEYRIASEGQIVLMSGSKATGGFCVSRPGLLANSIMGNLFKEYPALCDNKKSESEIVRFKGRYYCTVPVTQNEQIVLNTPHLKCFDIKAGDKLLSIRGSNIAFVMGVKGPLINMANNYKGEIQVY